MKVVVRNGGASESFLRRFIDVALPSVFALVVLADIVTRQITWWTAVFAACFFLDVGLKVWKKRFLKKQADRPRTS